MEGPTYKGREGGEKGRGRVPRLLRFPPGPRGARIVTAFNQTIMCRKFRIFPSPHELGPQAHFLVRIYGSRINIASVEL